MNIPSAPAARLATAILLRTDIAWSQGSLSDPQGTSASTEAVRWLEGTLLGTLVTTVVIIAVAAIGFLMLTGRTDWRRGATVILGCFILFGARDIAAALQSLATPSSEPPVERPLPPPPPSPFPRPTPPAVNADPYAGASVPG